MRRNSWVWRLPPVDSRVFRGLRPFVGNLLPDVLASDERQVRVRHKCNLCCEICGSQKFHDITGVRCRHMDLKVFESVAETLFPLMFEVDSDQRDAMTQRSPNSGKGSGG